MRLVWLLALTALQAVSAQDSSAYAFGTTVVDSSGLHGRVFFLKPGTRGLPNLDKLTPVGSVYTNSLNIWPQQFDAGFPEITDRFEWFAIEYTGKIWVEKNSVYRFSLLSDDGSRLTIDDKVIVNNDGIHAAMAISGGATLTHGIHEIKVEYFQGPRFTVALVLAVAPEGEPWRIFNMSDFKPPKDLEDWQKGEVSDIEHQTVGMAGPRDDGSDSRGKRRKK